MTSVHEDSVQSLRSMARRGASPTVMLREIVLNLLPEEVDRAALVQLFAEAFCFTEGQAYPIFGWRPDGNGPLKDLDLDYLLNKRLRQTQAMWDRRS